jgi:CheY-like chemotaxis protein
LYLEDNPRDALLVQETLEMAGITSHVTRVDTEAEFIVSLGQDVFDLILADYTLPSFDGLFALKIAHRGWPHVPFILVSGTLDEEVAIEALKTGATDYVLKTRLSRIVPSVRRALRETEERIELRRAEEALRRSEAYLAEGQRLSQTGSFGWDASTGEIYWSRETFRIFEYEPATKVTIELVLQRTHPEDRSAVQEMIDRVSRDRTRFDFEHRLLMPDRSIKYLRVVGHPSKDKSGSFEFVGAVADITERKGAVEILRRSEDLEIAKQVQARLFPQTLPSMRTLDYAGICIQARQVGGDYYDYLNLGNQRLGLVIADVAGKGIAAALLMANLQANLRSQCDLALNQPQQFLRCVNQLFWENTTGAAYATLFFGEYDDSTRRLRYANCGHLSGLLLRHDNTLERLQSTSTVLGLFKDWDCAIGGLVLSPGDTLALYTDGITESFDDSGEQFGEWRLIEALRRHRELPSPALLEAVIDEVLKFSPREQQDDITLVVAKCREN